MKSLHTWFSRSAWRWGAVLSVCGGLLLSACGGGGAGGAAAPPIDIGAGMPANAAPVAKASGPSVTPTVDTLVTLDGSASTDPEGSGLTYLWTLQTPEGSAAKLGGARQVNPTFAPDVVGSYVATLVVNDGAKDSAPVTVTVVVGAAPIAPEIQLSKAEPLSETVKLSLSGTVGGPVTWYVNLKLLGTGNAADNYAINWPTTGVANGTHQILARIQTSAASYQDLQRTVNVSNPTVTLSATVSGTTGQIVVDVRANSTFGVTGVSATLDGQGWGTLNAPNACSRYCTGANDVYRFTVDAAAVGSGAHTMVITATDGNATSKSVTVSVPVSNAAVLTLTSPSDGTLVYRTLRVTGTATSDKAGPVTTVATLGDVQVLNTQSGSFDASYNVTGVSPGTYTLTVKATDSSGLISQLVRSITITSSASLGYLPVFALPTGATVLAAEGTQLLFKLSDGGVMVRDLISGAQVSLASAATIQYATDWQLSGGRVYVEAKDTDCTPTFNCIYEWSASGVRKNLSTASPYTAGSSYQVNPVARDGYVIWTNWNGPNAGSYTLYNASTQSFTKISQPATMNYVGNTDYDFSVSAGVVDFWYWGQTSGSGTSSTFDIYNWRSATGVSSRITSGGVRNIYPQVDGARAVWQQSPVGGSADGTFTLMTQGLPAGTFQILGTQATQYKARDAVTAWISTSAGGGKTLRALHGSTTYTLSTVNTANLLAVGSGFVIFSESGKTYSWSSATATKTLLLEATPTQMFISNGAAVFSLNSSVYRVGLN